MTCAGIEQDFTCSRCGDEDEFHRPKLCARCCLKDDLAALLAGPSGDVHPELKPIFDALTSQKNPRSAIIWLRNPDLKRLLSGFADGSLPITHESLQSCPSKRTATHLGELLMKHGALEQRDKFLTSFEEWLEAKLVGGPEYDRAGLLRKFATWHHLKRLREIADSRPLTHGAMASAKQEMTVSANFLEWLHGRGLSAEGCQQADIDLWLTSGPTTRSLARTFVRWCVARRSMPAVDFPYRVARSVPMLSNKERIEHLRHVLDSDEIPGWLRVAAVLLLLYAQPVTRICGLRIDDVLPGEESVEIKFDQDRVPVPEPFGALIRTYLPNRANMKTASNADAPWLFPGTSPGRHVNAQHLMKKLRGIGINLHAGRNAALRELVLEAPPFVVAKMLGYGPGTAERHAQAAGATWSSYPGLRDGAT